MVLREKEIVWNSALPARHHTAYNLLHSAAGKFLRCNIPLNFDFTSIILDSSVEREKDMQDIANKVL